MGRAARRAFASDSHISGVPSGERMKRWPIGWWANVLGEAAKDEAWKLEEPPNGAIDGPWRP